MSRSAQILRSLNLLRKMLERILRVSSLLFDHCIKLMISQRRHTVLSYEICVSCSTFEKSHIIDNKNKNEITINIATNCISTLKNTIKVFRHTFKRVKTTRTYYTHDSKNNEFTELENLSRFKTNKRIENNSKINLENNAADISFMNWKLWLRNT